MARCSQSRLISAILIVTAAAALTACADGNSYTGDPGARALPAGKTCQSIRGELNKMDAQGAQAKVEAVSQGRKVDANTKAVSDRYNQLLNEYLGARCHA